MVWFLKVISLENLLGDLRKFHTLFIRLSIDIKNGSSYTLYLCPFLFM